MTSKERQQIVQDALSREYSELWQWARPDLQEAIGPDDLDHVNRFEQELLVVKADAIDALLSLPDEELEAISSSNEDRFRIGLPSWQDHIGPTLRRLSRGIPPPIAYGFGHPDFATDFIYWAQMPNLSFHEALMVSVGVEPASLTFDDLSVLQTKRIEKNIPLFAAQEFLLKRRELVTRFFGTSYRGNPTQQTRRVKAWFDEIELEIHPDFRAALDHRFDAGPKSARDKAVSEPFSSQERTTLLKLIAAMACEQYGFKLDQARSDTAPRIIEDLDSIGASLDAKTVRKWLKEAAKQVDPDYWTKGP